VPAFGMGIVWFGYSLASWGYILVKGYNVKFTDWINPLHPYSGKWPPPPIDDPTVILPPGAGSETLPKLPPDPFGPPKPAKKPTGAIGTAV
jgi:hypothetical protein